MPQDTQIFVGDNQAGSSDYQIPGNAEIRVKAVNANFVDNGAGADWCPAVVMFSDSGSVIARALLPDVKVTAGGDAEVSFFPGVKPGGGGVTPTGTTLAYAQGVSDFAGGDPVQTVASGAHANGTHAHVSTTDASRLSWSTTVNTNDTLTLQGPGTFLVWAHTLWQASDPALTSQIMNTFIDGFRHGPWIPLPNQTFVPSDGIANMQDYNVLHASGGGGIASVLHQNGTPFSANVEVQFMTAVFLGTG